MHDSGFEDPPRRPASGPARVASHGGQPRAAWLACTAVLPLLVSALPAQGAQTSAKEKAAQQQATAEAPTLAAAVVVEVYEHDLGRAMRMYRVIIDDEARGAEERTQARLRLARVHLRLGQAEAARAMFTAAANGTGPAAKEAAAALAGAAQDDGDLVKAKVEQALLAMRLSGKADASGLSWIGEAAVPYVIRAVEAETSDLQFLTNAATVLFQIGGPEVVKWIDELKKSKDVLRKRAVIRGRLPEAAAATGRAVGSFLADPDPTVRLEVLSSSSSWNFTAAQVVAALGDTDPRVRQRALGIVRNAWGHLEHEGKALEHFRQALPVFEAHAGSLGGGGLEHWLQGDVEKHSGVWVGGSNSASNFPATDEGRRLALQAIGLPCFRGVRVRWPRVAASAGKNLHTEDVLATARRLGAPDWRSNLMRSAVSLRDAIGNLLPFWDRDALPVVLELVGLGWDCDQLDLGTWVARHAIASDLPAVTARLGDFRSNAGLQKIFTWMTSIGAPESALEPLVRFVENQYRSMPDDRTRTGEFEQRIGQALVAIRSIGSPRAIDHLVGTLRRPGYRTVLDGDPADARVRAVLLRVLVLPSAPGADQDRAYAFAQLVSGCADPGDPQLFARAYELGLGESGPAWRPGTSRPPSRGLGITMGIRPGHVVRATLAPRVAILDACLSIGSKEAWKDLSRCLDDVREAEIAVVIARHVARCPRLDDQLGVDVRPFLVRRAMELTGSAPSEELAVAALAHESAAVREITLSHLDGRLARRPAVLEAVVVQLGSEDVECRNLAASYLIRIVDSAADIPGLNAAMEARLADSHSTTVEWAIQFLQRRAPDVLLREADTLLRHPDVRVHAVLAASLLHACGAKAVGKAGPVVLDGRVDLGMRRELIKQLGSLMEPSVVPYLLQALKLPEVQATAQDQLAAIRFYHEQTKVWNSLLEGGGFTETSAAEALVKQAGSPNRAVRLAAIASLGTLAEPHTLPFLVQLVGSEDQEVAAAAKSAVDRINDAARPADAGKSERGK